MSDAPYGERRNPSSRFLPPDPSVSAPYRLTPGLAVRVGVLGIVAIAVFALLFFRLWSLQVLSGARYLDAAQNNQLRTIRVEAPRGPILDREGKVIVGNVPGHGGQALGRRHAEEGGALPDDQAPRDRARRPDGSASRRRSTTRRVDPLTPITVKTAVHDDQVYYLQEHASEFPGVQIQQTYLRSYPYQSLAAQVLGYVGEISPAELKAKQKEPKSDYRGGDKIGKSGVEATFDGYLNGTAGAAQIRVDSLGRPQSPLEIRRDAQPGMAVRLTIDMRVQRAAEQAIREGIALARANKQYNVAGGAIIALDPRDGAVRAMASYPDLQAVRLRRPDRPEEARAAREQRRCEGGQLPRPQPRHAGRVPAGIDLEAGHRARRDAGAPALAVLVDPVHARARSTAATSRSSRTGIRTSTGR